MELIDANLKKVGGQLGQTNNFEVKAKAYSKTHPKDTKFNFTLLSVGQMGVSSIINERMFLNFLYKPPKSFNFGNVFVFPSSSEKSVNKQGKFIFYISKSKFDKIVTDSNKILSKLAINNWPTKLWHSVPDVWFKNTEIVKFINQKILKNPNIKKLILNNQPLITHWHYSESFKSEIHSTQSFKEKKEYEGTNDPDTQKRMEHLRSIHKKMEKRGDENFAIPILHYSMPLKKIPVEFERKLKEIESSKLKRKNIPSSTNSKTKKVPKRKKHSFDILFKKLIFRKKQK